MNHITLSGRLTKDPELRKTQNGRDVANFSIAVRNRQKDAPPDYFDCHAWGKKDEPGLAGTIMKCFHKGDGITVQGVMTIRKYQDKNGNARTDYSVQVDEFEFPLTRKQDGGNVQQPTATPAGEFTEVQEDELPF